ncbi:MAG: M23 family metallopeptidase [Flavobacteriales bacterium]|nr:M23 family metallopeptidase [Flavobacteriales bacterium]
MSKVKYKYNPETLSYDEVELTWRDHLRKLSYYAIASIVASILILFFSYSYIKERGKREAVLENEQTEAMLKEKIQELNDISVVLDEIQQRDDNIYRLIFGADPYPQYKRVLGVGGNQKKNQELMAMDHGELLLELSNKIAIVEKKLYAQSVSFDSVIAMSKKKEDLLKAVPSIQPISNDDLTHLASGFGMRMHPIYKILKMHTGLDFTADIGTPIFATGDAVVEQCDVMSGYGQMVVLNHGFGYKTRYAHVSEYKCKPGQKVKRGDVIALVGNTGASVGPHLHYEVLYKGVHVNPVNYFFNDLSPEEFEEVVRISSQPTQSM